MTGTAVAVKPQAWPRHRHLPTVADVAWMDQGACSGRTDITRLFFKATSLEQDHAPAKRICAGCPVQERCLEYALANVIDHGVWGGATEEERRAIRRARAVARASGLRHARERAGLSQKRLAHLAGLSSNGAISELEHGRWAPSRDLAIRLAVLLDVPIEDLFPQVALEDR